MYLILLNGTPIVFGIKKQCLVADSTCEVEFIALLVCIREVCYIHGILENDLDAIFLARFLWWSIDFESDYKKSGEEKTKHIGLNPKKVADEPRRKAYVSFH